MVAGSADFIGVNFYTVDIVTPKTYSVDEVSYYADSDTATYQRDTWTP